MSEVTHSKKTTTTSITSTITSTNTKSLSFVDASAGDNQTPALARIAAMDYLLNGSRARANVGGFVGPRWIPDPEANTCSRCTKPFDWFNRKHHCRHCGKIFCNPCSSQRSLLPNQFGYRDAQRVCDNCHRTLLPQQHHLTSKMIDYQRSNPVTVPLDDFTCEGWSPRRYLNMPYSKTLGSEIRKATFTIFNIMGTKYIKDSSLPTSMIASAWGLVFISTVRVASVFGCMAGTGLLVSRLADGRWSGPVAIGLAGGCWGGVIGVNLSDCVIALTSPEAVQTFAGRGQISIGVGAEVVLGPLGRSTSYSMSVGDGGTATAWSYSQSRGFCAGIYFQGSVIFSRFGVNTRFYGRDIIVSDILSGVLEPPRAAQPLYDALRDAEALSPGVSHTRSPYSVVTDGPEFSYQQGFYQPDSRSSSNQNGKNSKRRSTGYSSDSDSDGFHEYTTTRKVDSYGVSQGRGEIVISQSPSSFGWKSYASTNVTVNAQRNSSIFLETGGIIDELDGYDVVAT